MKPDGKLKLVSQLLDLPLHDSEGKYCGIVDDVELVGGAGKARELKALLVGPGAYSGRLPRWAMWLVGKVAGTRVTRIPLGRIRTISDSVHLERPGDELGLHRSEKAAAKWIPREGAL
jgi:sporulation protein YlmC with PRC-barrel domain